MFFCFYFFHLTCSLFLCVCPGFSSDEHFATMAGGSAKRTRKMVTRSASTTKCGTPAKPVVSKTPRSTKSNTLAVVNEAAATTKRVRLVVVDWNCIQPNVDIDVVQTAKTTIEAFIRDGDVGSAVLMPNHTYAGIVSVLDTLMSQLGAVPDAALTNAHIDLVVAVAAYPLKDFAEMRLIAYRNLLNHALKPLHQHLQALKCVTRVTMVMCTTHQWPVTDVDAIVSLASSPRRVVQNICANTTRGYARALINACNALAADAI
jgi:hypothetical protein